MRITSFSVTTTSHQKRLSFIPTQVLISTYGYAVHAEQKLLNFTTRLPANQFLPIALLCNTQKETAKMATTQQPTQDHNVRLLWNQESVKDVAESVGISSMSDETQRTLTQEVEYRVGQVIIESMRFMKGAGRTTLTVQDVNAAMRTLDIEPLYGYDSTRPLRYGEASLGPGQPIFYVEDEEVDFEKIINAPLPKIPRDMAMTGMPSVFAL
jgi:histone H3/H4